MKVHLFLGGWIGLPWVQVNGGITAFGGLCCLCVVLLLCFNTGILENRSRVKLDIELGFQRTH